MKKKSLYQYIAPNILAMVGLYQYIAPNILAMVGMSCYILADIFFIATSQGTNGITALNLALPIYGLIFAIGSMIGTGSAIRYKIFRRKPRGLPLG